MWSRGTSTSRTDGRTDWRTEDVLWHSRALKAYCVASRGKNLCSKFGLITLDAPSLMEPLPIIRIRAYMYLIFLETRIIGIYFAADNWVYLRWNFYCDCGLRKTILYFCKSDVSAVQGYPRSFDFGTNRKGVCDFSLVRQSNLGPILHRFGDYCSFLRWQADPTNIPP